MGDTRSYWHDAETWKDHWIYNTVDQTEWVKFQWAHPRRSETHIGSGGYDASGRTGSIRHDYSHNSNIGNDLPEPPLSAITDDDHGGVLRGDSWHHYEDLQMNAPAIGAAAVTTSTPGVPEDKHAVEAAISVLPKSSRRRRTRV